MTWQEDLERDGYAIVPGVIDAEHVSRLVAAIDAMRPDGAVLQRGGRVYASRNLLGDVPEARRLAESAELRQVVEPVLGPSAFAVRGLLFDKTPEANWTVPWHQDMTIAVRSRLDVAGYGPWTVKAGIPHVQPPTDVLEGMLTVRVQLDDAGPAQGPLRVVPGSHRSGKLGVGATRDWLLRAPAVSCVVPAGGALVMRPLLLHASSPAESPGHRRIVHLEYAARPLPAGLDWFDACSPAPRKLVS